MVPESVIRNLQTNHTTVRSEARQKLEALPKLPQHNLLRIDELSKEKTASGVSLPKQRDRLLLFPELPRIPSPSSHNTPHLPRKSTIKKILRSAYLPTHHKVQHRTIHRSNMFTPSHQTHFPHHHPHLPSSPSSSFSAKKSPQQPQQNLIYLAIALLGVALLVAKPALLIFVLLLMGYGKYYHVEIHETRHGLLREKSSERSVHWGPDREHAARGDRGFRRESLQDFAKGVGGKGLEDLQGLARGLSDRR